MYHKKCYLVKTAFFTEPSLNKIHVGKIKREFAMGLALLEA